MDKPFGLVMRGIAVKDDKILLLKRHPKCRTYADLWEFPGGKAEKNEYFDQTLIREFKEETNLDISIDSFFEALEDVQPKRTTVQVYMKVNIKGGNLKISDEHIDYAWKSLDEMKEMNLSRPTLKVLEKKNWKI
jgi:8-oxo-dGTP diphosphatase